MRTIKTKVYTFEELSEEAKEKVIENLYTINVDFDWWMFTYEDAERAGLKITSFDLDRNRHAEGDFLDTAWICADKITKEHGENCETYKTAKEFLNSWNVLVEKYSDGIKTDIVKEENEGEFDREADELENEFLNSIVEDYSMMLQKEYEYQMSDEAIIETIEANEYEFTENGKLI